jgi:hypothetical protein
VLGLLTGAATTPTPPPPPNHPPTTPIHNILSTAPQFSISQKALGTLPEDGTHTHSRARTQFCRIPLDEWSACCRDLYLTTHNTHKRLTSMAPVAFEPAVPTSERPYTHVLDRPVTVVIILHSSLEFKCTVSTSARSVKKCTQHILFDKLFLHNKRRHKKSF